MSCMIRGKLGVRSPATFGDTIEINGPSPWIKCECGKYLDRETGEHVEVETLKWSEFMEKYGPKCPDKAK